MSIGFRITLYTIHQLSDIKILTVLWQLLDNPLISPQRYDSVERAKLPFHPEVVESAAQIFQKKKILFVRGKKDSFLGVFTAYPRSLSIWDFWLDLHAMQSKKATHWMEWFFHLCNELPILYGFGCSETEYDKKHRYVETLPERGAVTGSIGASVSEFYQYLPGLYWVTIFGPELVQAFGQSNLMTLPHVNEFSLSSGQVAICLDEPVLPENIDHRLRTESQIADILGAKFFFDRNRPDLQFEAVPQLIKVLNQFPLDHMNG